MLGSWWGADAKTAKEDLADMTAKSAAAERERGFAQVLNTVAEQGSHMGKEAADVRGLIDDTGKAAAKQAQSVHQLVQRLEAVLASQEGIVQQTRSGTAAVANVRHAVESIGEEVGGIVETLREVSAVANDITKIALQTRLVAFNAMVEAKRAGEAGRGFGMVADAVKDLAARVEASSKAIMGTVNNLDARIDALARDIQAQADGAPRGAVHKALADVEVGVAQIHESAVASQSVCHELNDEVDRIEGEVNATARMLDTAMRRSESFLTASENLLETVAECGLETEDTLYIKAVQDASHEIEALLEGALQSGQISEVDLFDENYVPVEGTNPQQHLTRFVSLADRLFPQVQERLLGLTEKVVFCISADRNGYIATHNSVYNNPQRGNLAWDTANSRYRRIFNDRTGLAAGRNQRPFLLQTYRRDMGGGNFIVMKEVDAPIRVAGKHWGGLRLAYKF